MAVVDLSKVSAIDDEEIKDEENILGYLVGVVHRKFVISQEEMLTILEEEGLHSNWWPNTPSKRNAFKLACRTLDSTVPHKTVFRDPGTGVEIPFMIEYMVDSLRDGARQLTRKIHYIGNEDNDVLRKRIGIFVETTQKEPEKMAKFQLVGDEIQCVDLYENQYRLGIGEQTKQKYAEVKAQYERIVGSYTESYLKVAWHRMVIQLGGIPWMRQCGSLWFVPKSAWTEVEAFLRVFNRVHKGELGRVRTIPLIDSEKHRQYLMEDVEAECESRVRIFLSELGRSKEVYETDETEVSKKLEVKYAKFEKKLHSELLGRYKDIIESARFQSYSNVISMSENTEELSPRMKKARDLLSHIETV